MMKKLFPVFSGLHKLNQSIILLLVSLSRAMAFTDLGGQVVGNLFSRPYLEQV